MLRYLRTTGCPEISNYPLHSIDSAMRKADVPSVFNTQSQATVFVTRVMARLRLVRNLHRSPAGPVFVSFMGYSENRIIPIALWNEIVPYCFDCWPALYERWTSFFKRYRVRLAFFSARQSAEHFAKAIPEMRCEWLPEACDPSEYCPMKPWAQRDIDVLELGRKFDGFHNRVRGPLAKKNRTHLYERIKGQVIFPNKDALIDGYARARISVCFPCSITHPARSGPVETVTLRYFQSMASKCVILGHAPSELTDLFGFNPVIEVQEGQEPEQIEALLGNPDSCLDIVEENFRRLMEVGTWDHRVKQILETYSDHSA